MALLRIEGTKKTYRQISRKGTIPDRRCYCHEQCFAGALAPVRSLCSAPLPGSADNIPGAGISSTVIRRRCPGVINSRQTARCR